MSCVRLSALLVLAVPSFGQSIISTHAGVVHYFEGAVSIDGKPLAAHVGTFASVPQGSELRTADGKAEVLLTPGVFLRIGNDSAVRMVSNDLADTRVELESGAAIVDAGEVTKDTSVCVTYKDWRVHVLAKGVYRIDSDPPHVSVAQGKAEVFAGTSKEPVAVEAGNTMPFAQVLVPENSNESADDALSEWENGRSESIAADNAIAAQIDQDPATAAGGDLDGFTYFPLIDVPYLGGGRADPYAALATFQPGFNSLYLPGYTYAPILLGLAGYRNGGLGVYIPSPPLRLGTGGIGRMPLGGGSIYRNLYGYHPMPPILRSAPAPIRMGAPVHVAPPVMAPRGGLGRR